jgi:phosphoribosylanthranilate isomerase
MVKVKICGVTNTDDAILVANLGADYIGFNFYKESPRKVSVNKAKEMIEKLPSFVTSVGDFVDEELNEVVKIAKKSALKMIQLHGNETVDYCSQLVLLTSLPIIKCFRIENEGSLQQLEAYKDVANYFLLDAHVPGQPGGTGEVFNWDIAVKAKELNKPMFLAGGLTPENIKDAISKVQPFAVDVASGVERLQRRKDYDKMNKFVRVARGL